MVMAGLERADEGSVNVAGSELGPCLKTNWPGFAAAMSVSFSSRFTLFPT